jgi:hypothetical protein
MKTRRSLVKPIRSTGKRRLGPIINESTINDNSDSDICPASPNNLPIERSPFVTHRRGGSNPNSATKNETPKSPFSKNQTPKSPFSISKKLTVAQIHYVGSPKTPLIGSLKYNTPTKAKNSEILRSPFFITPSLASQTPKTPPMSLTKRFISLNHPTAATPPRSPTTAGRQNSPQPSTSKGQTSTSKCQPSSTKCQPSTSKGIPKTPSSPHPSPRFTTPHQDSSNYSEDLPYAVDFPTPTPSKPPRGVKVGISSKDEFKTPAPVEGKLSFLASLSFDDPSER